MKFKLGELIIPIDNRNRNSQCTNLMGLSMTKEFRPSTSNIVGTDLSKYKIVKKNEFAVDFMSVIRVHKMPIALNKENEEILVSPAYAVFKVKNENKILTKYLMMWFSRSEFDRYADFRSDAAIRGGYGWDELCETEIELPSIDEQKEIVKSYTAITERIALKKQINDNLEAQLSCLFHILFDNNATIPCTIGDFGDIVAGATPSTDIKENFCSDGIVWLSPKDLTSSGKKFISKGETDITEVGYKSCSTKLMPKGTVLLTSRAPVGTVAIATVELCTNQGFKSIVPKKEIGTEFVYYFLKENKALLDSHSSGTTFMEISGSILKSIPAFIPRESELKVFRDACMPAFEIQMQNEIEIQQLCELRRVLLSQISSR